MKESAWFYSSLTQVTATLVGFIGGFLILRLLNLLAEWEAIGKALENEEGAWLKALWTMEQTPVGEGEPGLPPAYEKEEVAWDALYRTIKQREQARVPFEIWVSGLILLALLAVGTVWPLVVLDAPSTSTQLRFVIPWSVLILIFAGVAAWRTVKAWRDLKAIGLSRRTEAKVFEYELNAEESARRIEEERANRHMD